MLRQIILSAGLVALVLFGTPSPASAGNAPPLMLANVYRGQIALADYWVSEKYDGMRGYWDGKHLLSRGGETIAAPAWFTAGWPETPLDGELWMGRGQFSRTVATVRAKVPDETAWRDVYYMVFDLPGHPATFSERNGALAGVIAAIDQPWVRHVEQFKVTDPAALRSLMKRIVKAGGEGLILHRGSSLYRAERNDDLLKLKPYEDGEAQVIAHHPGKGRHAGQLGALEVATAQGQRFRLGSGLTDAQRRNPPPIGAWVTYRFTERHAKSGLPRFPRFLRVREDMEGQGNAAENARR